MKKINFLKWRQYSKLLTLLIGGFTLLILPNIIQAQNTSIAQLIEKNRTKGANFEPVKLLEIDVQNARKTNVQQWVSDETLLQINTKELTTLRQKNLQSLTLAIPNDNQILELELVQQDVVTKDFIVKTKGDGQEKVVDYQAGIHYRGIIKGQTQSIAAISIFNDRIIGGIFHGTKQYTLGPVDDSEQNRNIQHVFYEAENLKIRNNFVCDTDDTNNARSTDLTPNHSRSSVPNPDNCVRVYFECDHQMYIDRGSSVQNTVDYLLGIYNQVDLIFQNENVNTSISEIVVWTGPDSYSTNSSADALSDFRNEVGGTFNGDVAHLLTTGNYGNGGRARVDALCNKALSHAYSNIENTYNNFPTYSWTVMVIAHEIGHNLGPWHTHNCEWNGDFTAIDGCGPEADEDYIDEDCDIGPIPSAGTIMSYCHLLTEVGIDLSLGFGPQPGDLIRDRVYNASCLSRCNLDPCLDEFNIIQTYSTGEFSDVEASNQITSTSTIEPGTNITFDAGNKITLLPDFHAQAGCNFLAVIDGCEGVYKTEEKTPPIVLQELNPALVDKSTISNLKSYPNPFSESTILSYTLSEDQSINLSIFNANGQEIARLLENTRQIAGTHEVTFDGQDLPNGLYFYRFMDSDGNITTGKMSKF